MVLQPYRDKIRFRPKDCLPEGLLQELQSHKEEVLDFLISRQWPSESLEAEGTFGNPLARLYPFLGKMVSTPMGPGTLLQAFSVHAAVRLDTLRDRATFFHWQDIQPPGRRLAATGSGAFAGPRQDEVN